MTDQQGEIIIDLLRKIAAQPLADLDSIALDAAKTIEDIFAQGHVGGRAHRLAKVQCAIHRAILAGRREKR